MYGNGFIAEIDEPFGEVGHSDELAHNILFLKIEGSQLVGVLKTEAIKKPSKFNFD
jgi:hypothetical protein